MMGVPATYLFLAQEPGFAEADLSSLRLAVVGGAPMPEALLETWHERGVDIVQGYGLTEAAPNVLCLPAGGRAPQARLRREAVPARRRRAPRPESGAVLDGPATGELLVRGPNVFAGYWRDPDATAAVLRDGWLATGDVAERDDEGFYRIAGRLKELVISGGENVYPAEIESVLHDHPAVAEAAVVGVPDERWGEACAAFVVLREGDVGDRGRAPRALRRAPRPVQGAAHGRARRGAAALGAREGAEGRASRDRDGGGVVSETLTGRRRQAALEPRRAHAPAAARGGRDRLRRARLPRRLDREAHRGRGRRAGHLLPLLREQEGRSSTSSSST